MNTEFNIIDYDNWDRKEIFESLNPLTYTISADLDITAFYTKIKAKGYKFYPSINYIIAKVVNENVEFRYAFMDGKVGYYDRVDPLYTLIRVNSNHLYTHAITEYNPDFSSFYMAFERDRREAELCNRLYFMDVRPDNALSVSITPNLKFNHISYNYTLDKEGSLVPFVSVGKYYDNNGRKLLPTCTEFHHEVNDGYHAGKFYELMQDELDRFDC